MDDDIIKLSPRGDAEPEPDRTITWHQLPKATQDILRDAFEAEMRSNFEEIMPEVVNHFILYEVPEEWKAFRESWFDQEMHSVDTQCAFDDWLGARGIVP